ncbi:MAG: alpha/beta hydrolase [Hyphomicrobium sp.]
MAEADGAVSHHVENIRGIDIFYREAGPKTAPVLLLLHGFPSSSHMFRDLIPQLSDKYRVIAPDYPGFGYSGAPKVGEFDYTFDSVANLISELTEKLGAKQYVLYMQDYGGPVGFRLALKHPDRVRGIVVQNATLFAEGWYPKVTEPFGPFWKSRSAETEAPMRGFLMAETTKWQYTQGTTRTDRLSPDAWTHDQARLDRPGNDAIQLQYLWNYQDNLAQYPAWQAWLKTKQPPTLVVWGKGDPFFTTAGVDALKALVPKATVNIYDAGHFALESHGPEIATAMRDFLAKLPN